MPDERRSVTISDLSRKECERLLAGQGVGRLGIAVDGQPHILPVNYAHAGGGEIVFRTASGTLLTEASLRRVAFEVDAIDSGAHEGGDPPSYLRFDSPISAKPIHPDRPGWESDTHDSSF